MPLLFLGYHFFCSFERKGKKQNKKQKKLTSFSFFLSLSSIHPNKQTKNPKGRHRCRQAGKPVIVASHLLQSMIEYPTPTRAEVADVSDVVRQRADALMLSGESAVGAYPGKAVEVLRAVATHSEEWVRRERHGALVLPQLTEAPDGRASEELCAAAAQLAGNLGARAIFVYTRRGYMANFLSRCRPDCPVFAFTDSQDVRRRLNLRWGVMPFRLDFSADPEENVTRTFALLKRRDLVTRGDLVVVVSDIRTLDQASEAARATGRPDDGTGRGEERAGAEGAVIDEKRKRESFFVFFFSRVFSFFVSLLFFHHFFFLLGSRQRITREAERDSKINKRKQHQETPFSPCKKRGKRKNIIFLFFLFFFFFYLISTLLPSPFRAPSPPPPPARRSSQRRRSLRPSSPSPGAALWPQSARASTSAMASKSSTCAIPTTRRSTQQPAKRTASSRTEAKKMSCAALRREEEESISLCSKQLRGAGGPSLTLGRGSVPQGTEAGLEVVPEGRHGSREPGALLLALALFFFFVVVSFASFASSLLFLLLLPPVRRQVSHEQVRGELAQVEAYGPIKGELGVDDDGARAV